MKNVIAVAMLILVAFSMPALADSFTAADWSNPITVEAEGYVAPSATNSAFSTSSVASGYGGYSSSYGSYSSSSYFSGAYLPSYYSYSPGYYPSYYYYYSYPASLYGGYYGYYGSYLAYPYSYYPSSNSVYVSYTTSGPGFYGRLTYYSNEPDDVPVQIIQEPAPKPSYKRSWYVR